MKEQITEALLFLGLLVKYSCFPGSAESPTHLAGHQHPGFQGRFSGGPASRALSRGRCTAWPEARCACAADRLKLETDCEAPGCRTRLRFSLDFRLASSRAPLQDQGGRRCHPARLTPVPSAPAPERKPGAQALRREPLGRRWGPATCDPGEPVTLFASPGSASPARPG